MNIVRLAGAFPSPKKVRHGLGPTLYHLSKEQVELGLNVHVICKRASHERKHEEIDDIHVHRVPPPYNFSALYELIKLERHIKPDIVHSHATSCPSYALLGRPLHRRRVGHVIHVHATRKSVMAAYEELAPQLAETTLGLRFQMGVLRESIVWKRADALIAVSEALAKDLVNLYGIPPERVHVVYNGVDTEVFHRLETRDRLLKKLGLEPGSRLILYLGGFRPVKGPMYLIKALRQIYERFRNVKVLFVGNPKHPSEGRYVKPMINLIKSLRISKAVHMVNNIPHHQMPEYFSAADALVVPSLYDSFPKVILEAMACKNPVIASAVGGVTELIRDSETGILVNAGNPDELAEAIIKVLSDTGLREKMSLKARKLVEQFTWKNAAKRILEVYEKLLY